MGNERTLTDFSPAEPVHVHLQTYIVLAAINFAYVAQIFSVVGAGMFAQPLQTLFAAPNQGTWMSQTLTILNVVLVAPLGQAADLWGRKWVVVIATVCGGVGSIVASRAEDMATVIGSFCVLGLAYGSQSLLHAIVSEILPRKHRPVAQGVINTTSGTACVVSILVAGSLLRHNNYENYRIYMYITGGVYFLAAIGVAVCYSPPPRELQTRLSPGEKLRSLSWTSYALFAPGLVLFCVALSWSRNPYPWSQSQIIAPFVVGLIFLVAFGVYEWRVKKDGIFHHRLFRNRNFPIALFSIFTEGVAFFAANSYFAFSVNIFTGSDYFMSGLPFAVVFMVGLTASLVSGLYSFKQKQLRLPIVTGFVAMTVAFICLAATTGGNPNASFYGFAVLLGLGLGIVIPLVMVIAQLSTPADLISIASALVIACRALGATIGLAVNNAIFTSALSTEIPKKVAAAVIPLGLPTQSIGMLIGALTTHDEALLASIPGVTPSIIGAAGNAITRAYGIAFRNCWIASACFTFVGAVACVLLFDPKDEFTGHIDAPAEQEVAEEQARFESASVEVNQPKAVHHEEIERT